MLKQTAVVCKALQPLFAHSTPLLKVTAVIEKADRSESALIFQQLLFSVWFTRANSAAEVWIDNFSGWGIDYWDQQHLKPLQLNPEVT